MKGSLKDMFNDKALEAFKKAVIEAWVDSHTKNWGNASKYLHSIETKKQALEYFNTKYKEQ